MSDISEVTRLGIRIKLMRAALVRALASLGEGHYGAERWVDQISDQLADLEAEMDLLKHQQVQRVA